MNLKEKYLKDASGLKLSDSFDGWKSCGWESPSNIALIKYWGKKSDQIPQNPSLSFTLKKSFTKTYVDYAFHDEGSVIVNFEFAGEKNLAFENRISSYLISLIEYQPFISQLKFDIRSSNSFPHSSGIASSASSMSSLALCLCDIENELFRTLENQEEFLKKASFLARLGSGSASRSVYGRFVLWGEYTLNGDSTNEAGIPYILEANGPFDELQDTILITSKEKKKVSSSAGHRLMENHPYAEARYYQANENLKNIDLAIKLKNEIKFASIIENEALSLHALMMSSNPGYNLLNENTWNIINSIKEFREKSGLFMTFTLDAGPNVHFIYKRSDQTEIKIFIKNSLEKYCENSFWINDEIGNGPKRIIND